MTTVIYQGLLTWRSTTRSALAALLLGALGQASAGSAVAAESLSSPWEAAHAARARLVVAGGNVSAGQPLTAGVQIELGDGWKTYWRHPGDAGGVPPSFDWAGSDNVSGTVLFPAPKRMTDKAGDTVGYKGAVTLPVMLTVADPGKPAKLRLKLEYGICREICVPAEAAFAIDVPAGFAAPLPEPVATALANVPKAVAMNAASVSKSGLEPVLVEQAVQLAGDKPSIRFVVRYPAGAAHTDAFVEVTGGAFMPLPRKDGAPQGDVQTYVVDLMPADAGDLKGQTLTVTMISDNGQSEAVVKLP